MATKKKKETRKKYSAAEAMDAFGLLDQKAAARTFSTGSFTTDRALGGGFMQGKIYEFWAEEGLGKSTSVLCAIEECLEILESENVKASNKRKQRVVYIDTEHAINDGLLDNIGILEHKMTKENPNGRFMLVHPNTYGDIEDIMDGMKDEIAFLVIDSVQGVKLTAVMEGRSEDVLPGENARAQSGFFPKLAGLAADCNFSAVCICQTRTKMAFASKNGSYIDSASAKALRFWADCRMALIPSYTNSAGSPIVNEKSGGPQLGSRNLIYCKKNKFTAPFRYFPVTVIFGKGVSNALDLFEILFEMDVITKSSTKGYFSVPGLAQGEKPKNKRRKEAVKWVSENYDALLPHAEAYFQSLEMDPKLKQEAKQEEEEIENAVS